jgi:hypothetical protein
MEVTLTIPDNVASEIQNSSTTSLSRRVLELTAIQAYESDLITEWNVIEMLGFDGREELYAFFKRYDVRGPGYSAADFDKVHALLASNGSEKSSVQELAELEAQVQAQGHKFYGIFADDPDALEVFDEIERLRDQETLANSLAASQP